MIKDQEKIDRLFAKIKKNTDSNDNIKNSVVKVSNNGIPYIRLDIVTKEFEKSWSNTIFIYINDEELVITDCQLFFDSIVMDRDNFNLFKNELKMIKKIISKYGIIHEYNEEECKNGLYKVINENDIYIELDNFIKCFKELSIALKIDSNEQVKLKYEKSLKEYNEIKKENRVDTFFEYAKCFIYACLICLLIVFIVCMVSHPFITIAVMCGIGMIAFLIKCIYYLATFWLPGGDLWKM